MHDPRVGRFFAVDPLAPKYPYYSPYQFSGNKVIQFIELEGLEESGSGSNSGNTAIKNSTTGLMSASLVGEISTTARIGATILESFEAIATGVEVVATGVATVEAAPAIAVGGAIGMGYMMYRMYKDGPAPPIYRPTSGRISCIQVYDKRPEILGSISLPIQNNISYATAYERVSAQVSVYEYVHGNSKNNQNPHIIYEIWAWDLSTMTRGTLKYGISDSKYNTYGGAGSSRPQSQVSRYQKTRKYANKLVGYTIIARVKNREIALLIEVGLVSNYFFNTHKGRMPPEQLRPLPKEDYNK